MQESDLPATCIGGQCPSWSAGGAQDPHVPNASRIFDPSVAASVEPGLLEIAAAIRGLDAQPDIAIVAHDLDGYFRSGGTATPHFAIKVGQALDTLIANARDDIPLAQAGDGRRSAFRYIGDHDLALAFRRIDA